MVVDLGPTTKCRLEEVARIAGAEPGPIVERLVDYFLGLETEKQKPFITKSNGVVII